MRKTKRTEEMERSGHRINLENKDLIILDTSLENPQGWRAGVQDVENMNTSRDKGVQPRMPNAKSDTKLNISTKCAKARREPPREPTMFKPPGQ